VRQREKETEGVIFMIVEAVIGFCIGLLVYIVVEIRDTQKLLCDIRQVREQLREIELLLQHTREILDRLE
jgi:hypothetical protein